MKWFKFNILGLILWAAMFLSCNAQVNVQDGFELQKLSKIWSKDRMVESALVIQSDVIRNGNGAAKISIKSGDVFEKGIGKSLDSERDELREADFLESAEGKTYEYQFSLFLPENFPIVPTRLVIAQWKQRCDGNDKCTDASPVLAIRYVSGNLFITVQTDSTKKTVFKTSNEVRNKWLDFKFKIRFSRLENGSIEAWLNNEKIVEYAGITAYSLKYGFANNSRFYFKTGLYRDLMKQPMTIYIDDYSKKELAE